MKRLVEENNPDKSHEGSATGKNVESNLYRVISILDETKREAAEAARKQIDPHWAP